MRILISKAVSGISTADFFRRLGHENPKHQPFCVEKSGILVNRVELSLMRNGLSIFAALDYQ